MLYGWLLSLILQQCLVAAATVERLGDESCLLQTGVTSHTRRQAGEIERDQESSERGAQAVPQFTINLDLPPQKRFLEVAKKLCGPYRSFYNKIQSPAMLKMTQQFATNRGNETPELMDEIHGISNACKIPAHFIHVQHFYNALHSMEGPYYSYMQSANQTLPSEEDMYKAAATQDMGSVLPGTQQQQQQAMATAMQQAMADMAAGGQPAPKVACTGIIANVDGSVWHARNLDVSWTKYQQPLIYDALFTKGGKDLFNAQMVFPLSHTYTGIRRGPNGYAYETNSRFSDTFADAQKVLQNIYVQKRPPSLWTARKILETVDNYEGAVQAFSTKPLPNPEFELLSGVKKGTILARNPDGVAYRLDLANNPYIIMTNYDYPLNDPKEAFLDAANRNGVSGRMRAQQILNASKAITPELLYSVLNDAGVIANSTAYQAMINVEKNTYNSTLVACAHCS